MSSVCITKLLSIPPMSRDPSRNVMEPEGEAKEDDSAVKKSDQ